MRPSTPTPLSRGSATGDRRDQRLHRRRSRATTPSAVPISGEQHALGEELADQPAAARADRRAHGDFALADRRAREQQARDVGAGDHQQERRGAEQREQRRAGRSRRLRRERHRARASSRRWSTGSPRRAASSARAARRSPRRAVTPGFSRKSDSMKCAPRLCCATSHVQPVPHVGVVRILKPRRHHADDGEERTVQRDRLADDRRIAAEPLAPQPMADDRDRLARIERLPSESRRRATGCTPSTREEIARSSRSR